MSVYKHISARLQRRKHGAEKSAAQRGGAAMRGVSLPYALYAAFDSDVPRTRYKSAKSACRSDSWLAA